jgi:hypothetical protein
MSTETGTITSWHSYPKIYALGHGAIAELFLDEIHAEEKIDGSQFSFGVFNGQLRCRSKGVELNLDDVEGMFKKAVETARELAPMLVDGWTYRAEYLQEPRHNILAYSRTPAKNLILFDVNTGHEQYMSYEYKAKVAEIIGLECVPLLWTGKLTSIDQLNELLERESVLGGQKIEGLVFKNYNRFGPDKKALMGKYVSERFKEKHQKEWRKDNPQGGDILRFLSLKYKSEVRWEKAVQHLREQGLLTIAQGHRPSHEGGQAGRDRGMQTRNHGRPIQVGMAADRAPAAWRSA